jgi:hypothetical protein
MSFARRLDVTDRETSQDPAGRSRPAAGGESVEISSASFTKRLPHASVNI